MQEYLIDTHCHIHDKNFFPNSPGTILDNSYKNQVKKLIVIGTSHQDSINAKEFADQFSAKDPLTPEIFWSYGIHPSEHRSMRVNPDFSTSRPIAIGEVGLDYHYKPFNRDAQIRLFEEMIDLSLKNQLPLIFHVREAFDDFFAVLDNFSGIRGVVHSFTGSKSAMKKALERDFFIGVNGMATYSTLPLPPIDRILLETDAPFLAPVPYRGLASQPAFIRQIAEWLTTQTKLTLPEVMNITTKNAEDLFRFVN